MTITETVQYFIGPEIQQPCSFSSIRHKFG